MTINYKMLISGMIAMIVIDYFYLSFMSQHFKDLVKKITKEEMVFSFDKAVLAYLFLNLGLYYFILHDLNKTNYQQKIIDAVILGLSIYGTYDFTNGVIFKDYDYYTSIIDTTWGGILFGLITLVVSQVSL